MRFTEVLVMALVFLLCFATCDGPRTKPGGSEVVSDKSEAVAVLKPQVVVLKQGDRMVDGVESKIGFEDGFTAAQFTDGRNGWAGTENSLYRTTDGGATWKRLTLNLPLDSHISSFFFIDKANGWLTVVNQSDVERYGLGNSSCILASSDGGGSWVQQASFPDEVDIGCIRFLNGNQGLAFGARVVAEKPPYNEILALSTMDGGKKWNNISETLKAALRNEYGIAADYAHYIDWSSPSRILCLTRYGRLIGSTDQGQTWKVIARFKDERPGGYISSTGYYKLVLDTRGRISVIAGSEGEEGYWGDFVINDDRDSWVSYELIRTPFRDAVFLSDREVLACGIEVHVSDGDVKSQRPPQGIILHSIDGGRSWSAIYRSKSNKGFFSLTKVGNDEFYAVGDDGTFLRFAFGK